MKDDTMAIEMGRRPRPLTKDEYYSLVEGERLPGRTEFVRGELGPFDDIARAALLANWGADAIVALTGPEVWRQALAALDADRR